MATQLANHGHAEPVGPAYTAANAVTLARTLGTVVIGGVAIGADHPALLVVAYAVYWAGDMLDGLVARRLDQETRLGAVLDIVSDRACTSILCVGLLAYQPTVALAAIPFFASFMVLDTMLSLSFLCFPIISPNYFGQVDRTVYRLNWSPPAKALNTAGVVALALAGAVEISAALAVLLIAVKVWSAARVLAAIEGKAR
ncbi:MAG: CDP-alcohol phosphatidyltransferase family protein [Nocardioidaceae bacterium]